MKTPDVIAAWSKMRFDKICKNIAERIDDPKQAGTDYYVGLEHLDSEEPEIRKHGTPDDVNATKLRFKAGQILFGKRRFYQRKLAVANREGICSAHMMVLEAIEGNIIKDFLPLLMQTEEFYERAMMISEGSLSPTIKWKNLAKQEFWIPPLPEQEKLVKIIKNLDETISKTQNLLDKLKNFKNAKSNELLRIGIGHTNFKKVKSLFGKYEQIPEGWDLEKIGTFLKINMGQSPPSKSYNQEKNGLPFYQGVSDFGDLFPEVTYWCSEPKKIADKNQILFSVRAPVGDVNITNSKCCIGRGLAALDPNDNDLYYCYYLIKNNKSRFLVYSQGTTYDAINRDEIANTKVPYTKNKKEQQKITSILFELDNDIDKLSSHLSILKTMRKSILNEKLTMKKQEEKPLVQ